MLPVLLAAAVLTASAAGAALPVLPIALPADGTAWPAPNSAGLYMGDVRAVLNVSASDIVGGTATAQIYWRRRDNFPEVKTPLATAAAGDAVPVVSATIGSVCGSVTIAAASPGLYYVYYLPYFQTGGGAWLHFHWYNCSDQTNHACVLGAAAGPTRPTPPVLVTGLGQGQGQWEGLSAGGEADACDTVTPASSLVLRLETRNAFHGFQDTELIAAPSEIPQAVGGYRAIMKGEPAWQGQEGQQQPEATLPPFLVYAEDAAHLVRNFEWLSARWALWPAPPAPARAPNDYVAVGVAPGTFHVFQIGLYAAGGDMDSVTASFSPLCNAGTGACIPSSALRVFNLGGLGVDHLPFTKQYNVSAGAVGSLYVGVDIPADPTLQGNFTGTATISCASCGGTSMPVYLTLGLAGPVDPLGGKGDIYRLGRMEWLDSPVGWEDVVPAPFIPVGVASSSPALTVTALNKAVQLGVTGLPTSLSTNTTKTVKGQPVVQTRSILAPGTAVAFTLFDPSGAPMASTTTQPAAVTGLTNSTVTWAATSTLTSSGSSGSVTMGTVGTLGFDSYLTFNLTLTVPSSSPAMSLSDAQLSYTLHPSMLAYMGGMGLEGSAFPGTPATDSDRHKAEAAGAVLGQRAADGTASSTAAAPVWAWRWSNTTCTNKLWTGRIDAGLLLNLKGDGDWWNSPMFGVDYPVVPFVPPSWGGAAALPTGNPYGVNVSAGGTVTAFTGPRTLQPGQSISFLFDLLLTPAKPLDLTAHWRMRTVQVGYGTDYLTPQSVAAQGATIVTLHQGIPGIVNGSMVNPYINYPFTPEVVPLLTNYTSQSNALGMRTKFYYTIRELSNHAAELFPLMSLQGEVLLNEGSTYVIPQPGYCQDWDCHGGEVFLHQHVQNNYTYCWQANLSDGEWDAAVCDRGTSRWLNYYINGLQWSVQQEPHINGVYYDGINFDRLSMQRVRRAVDSAMQARLDTLRHTQALVASGALPADALSDDGRTFLALPASQQRPHLDLHTGHEPTPPMTSYATHYAYVDQVWNGEGFEFNKGPAYWLVEVSSQLHGLTGDRLGGATPSDDFKGMLWGMSQRNSDAAPGVWALWDQARLNETAQVGWWEDAPLVTVIANCSQPAPPYHTSILATVYTAYGSHALVSVASFCPSDETVRLSFDWAGMGLSQATVQASMPAVPLLQKGGPVADPTGPFTVTAGNGVLLMLEAGAGVA